MLPSLVITPPSQPSPSTQPLFQDLCLFSPLTFRFQVYRDASILKTLLFTTNRCHHSDVATMWVWDWRGKAMIPRQKKMSRSWDDRPIYIVCLPRCVKLCLSRRNFRSNDFHDDKSVVLCGTFLRFSQLQLVRFDDLRPCVSWGQSSRNSSSRQHHISPWHI